MRQEPRWLSINQIRMLHAESIQLFGGSPGIRDVALLESALDRAKNTWHYDETVSLFELAAAYRFGIAKNHPFVDGDKRTSLLAIRSFLFINGYHFNPEEVETVTVIEGMEAGRVDEMQLADWLEANCSPRDKR